MKRSARPSLLARLRRDEGSVLVEALMSAVVLMIIALALLASLDTAAKGSSKTKARSVAAALADQDQERLRSFAVTALSNFHDERDVDASGGRYHIASRADWVRDATSTAQSCTADATQAQYLRITSTVTSALVGTEMAPVTQSSLVAPPVAAFGPDQGTLAVKVVDRDNKEVVNAKVTATSSSGTTLTDATNTAGCAVFGFVAQGNYDIAVVADGYVDTAGRATATQTGYNVQAGKVNLTQLTYDVAGSATFTYRAIDPLSSPAQWQPSRGWNAVISDGANPRAVTAAPFTAEPVDGITATPVFPATGPYTFFAGDCAGNDPTKAPANLATFFSTYPVQNQKVDRKQALAVALSQPSFKAKVVSATASPTIVVNETTGTPAGGTPSCGSAQKLGTAATWTTAKSASDNQLYVTKAWSLTQTPKFYDTGLPFGTYTVCALDATAKKYAVQTINLTNPTTPASITLDTTAASATTGTACP